MKRGLITRGQWRRISRTCLSQQSRQSYNYKDTQNLWSYMKIHSRSVDILTNRRIEHLRLKDSKVQLPHIINRS